MEKHVLIGIWHQISKWLQQTRIFKNHRDYCDHRRRPISCRWKKQETYGWAFGKDPNLFYGTCQLQLFFYERILKYYIDTHITQWSSSWDYRLVQKMGYQFGKYNRDDDVAYGSIWEYKREISSVRDSHKFYLVGLV